MSDVIAVTDVDVDVLKIFVKSISSRWSYPAPTPVRQARAVIWRKHFFLKSGVWWTPEFIKWIASNWNIWMAFYWVAKQAQQGGMKHWSARGVVHVLRWKMAIREKDSQWKINNNWSPLMGRLYNACTGTEFFRTRGGS